MFIFSCWQKMTVKNDNKSNLQNNLGVLRWSALPQTDFLPRYLYINKKSEDCRVKLLFFVDDYNDVGVWEMCDEPVSGTIVFRTT